MKKITAFIATPRKRSTYHATRQFLDNLKTLGEVESEIVSLSNYRLGLCGGCKVCFSKGEEFCPQKDDRDVLIEKMMSSDGVVFATPNYSFQVSALMKMFLDRLGFVFHRPRFFGKTFTSIVTQGFFGGEKIVKYLDFVASGLGFNTVKGCCVTVLDPMTEKEKRKTEKAIAGHSRRFYARLVKQAFPVPTLFKLWGFRMARTNIEMLLKESDRDYTYYRDKGWFESEYYYPVHLGVSKKAAGGFFDLIEGGKARRRMS